MPSEPPPVAMGLAPGGAVAGRGRVPASKSLAQRSLVCAGLAEGTTGILGLPDGSDVRAALALVAAAGARVEAGGTDRVRVDGRPPGPSGGWAAGGPVSVGESGTLARFATAAFALCGEPGRWQEIRAEGSLRSRRSPALFAALRGAGCGIERGGEEDGWPVRVRTPGPVDRLRLEAPGSSQEASALWIALAARPSPSSLEIRGEVPSRPYLELTRDVLARFGASVEGDRVQGPLRAPAEPLALEPDASSAAVLLAAACLSGGRVEIAGLGAGSAQPDAKVVAHLARFGCRAAGRDGALSAEGFPDRGGEIDLSLAPDLAPVLAAVAAAAAIRAGARSRLGGLGTLPGKESSRIEVLARGLESAGLETLAGPDFLEIRPGARRPSGEMLRLDPHGDHRMAFAFALLGLVVDGVLVEDPACVGKSWPGFWIELERLGARLARGS